MQIAAVVALLAVPAAWADGDPASDVLPTLDVFLPNPAPSAAVSGPLAKLVASANRGGNRLKVAVIASRTDLGSVPVLFGKPAAYARFLGLELRTLYAGVLVVVMPAGIGVYDGGRPTAAQEAALRGLPVEPGADGLTRTAEAAAQRLIGAHALRYVDVLPPQVVALEGASIQYAVADDSGRAAVTVQVLSGATVLATIRTPLKAVNPSAVYTAAWRRPRNEPPKLRFCVRATDPSGNRSSPSCARISR
ncbi:MAG TPA: hypothetical protein VGN06_04285 [Gaiellaceae bacterium]|jgi:hypothetical protein